MKLMQISIIDSHRNPIQDFFKFHLVFYHLENVLMKADKKQSWKIKLYIILFYRWQSLTLRQEI